MRILKAAAWLIATMAWCLDGAGGTAASAADVEFATTAELSAWKRRVEELEHRLTAYEEQGVTDETWIEPSTCDWSCRTPGLTVDAELLFLRAYNSDADFDSDADSARFQESVRLTLGWTGESGWGVRGRWFDYDLTTSDSSFQLQVADVEATCRLDLGPDWYGLVAAGGRYAEWEEGGEDNRLDGALGPVLGLEIGRYVTDNLSLYARGRQAMVFGQDVFDNNMAAWATELQMGADLRYWLNGSTSAFVRAAWEGQFWTGMATEDSETFGLTGFVLAIGLDR